MSSSGTNRSGPSSGQRTIPSAQASARCAKGALVRADRVHLVRDDAARQLVVELERLDRAASLELVEPVADAVHRAAEGVVELPRVAVVVAVREQEVSGAAVRLEPAEALRRDQRVDQHASAAR
jgi:hypothetical protein